ncbi:MAG: hypothetical protein JNK95_06095 [Candidatus Competibacter sp.]|nr:hypothetical protein [Candidatus Competibacter sp.]HRD50142.1 hypothetical protein [Candidatus Contendobacter sp.]
MAPINTSPDYPALDSAAQAWLDDFAADPLSALDRLLMGKVWLGGYAAAETSNALPQLLPTALLGWLKQQLHTTEAPPGVNAKIYAQALVDAFALLQGFDLPQTRAWCIEQVTGVWAWLKVQAAFRTRDPRPVFLRALALAQLDRKLLPFWMMLCRHGVREEADLALFGLRRMPKDDQGEVERGLPRALIQGFLDYGRTAARGDDSRKKEWLAEVDFLTAVYPMRRDQWAGAFREGMARRSPPKRLRHWLDERYPAANQESPRANRAAPLKAPYWNDEIRPLLDRFDHTPETVSPALRAKLDEHRHYARETGDSYFLTRTFRQLGEYLLNQALGTQAMRDPEWALDLGQEATLWEPSDHHSWALVARTLNALGDWTRARAVFWYARRRFPHNPFSHAQLGHALAMRDLVDEGEAVYRQAIRRFPDNPVCWADLAHTLRVAGRREQALAVCREAQVYFPKDQVLACGLTGVLIDLGRADEARAALDRAYQVSDASEKQQRTLADLRRRLDAVEARQPLPWKHPFLAKERILGDFASINSLVGIDLCPMPALGLAGLWRNANELQRAQSELQGLGRFPASDVERGLILVPSEGWAVTRDFFQNSAQRYPGDGCTQVHYQRARVRAGDQVNVADWNSLRGRFEEYAPVIRIEQNPAATMPAALTDDDAGLDEDSALSTWMYQAGAGSRRDLVEEDFLAARQVA